MSGPETKESLESLLSQKTQLPKVDQATVIGPDGAAMLPARPAEVSKSSSPQEDTVDSSLSQAEREHMDRLKEKLMALKVQGIEEMALQSEQQRKHLVANLFFGQTLEPSVLQGAEAVLQLSSNAALIELAQDGGISQEALAKHLLDYIRQQRSFGCSDKELAMLDSLEFHLTRLLQHLNPNIRLQQQQQALDDAGPDDDAGSAGPEKVDDDRESGVGGLDDADLDSDTSYSPRSKKGRARGRDRRSRFKKWMDRMMRSFRGQSLGMRGRGRTERMARARTRDRRFVKTVRIFGTVVHADSKKGIAGVKIVSNTLGSIETDADGNYAFENVAVGTAYALAPLKSGYTFLPLSINDVALDYREHNFQAQKG